jgi:hypothetical protein
MTREEAQRECDRLATESPDRETHRFLAREDEDGVWSVVKVGLPPTRDPQAKPESRADSRPPIPDDPRTVYNRNTGGPWVA